MQRAIFLFILLACCLPAWAQKPLVAVSVLPQKAFVQALLGNEANVQVLVGKGYNPATYQPKPQQITQLAQARLFVRAGMPFETAWLPRLRALNPKLEILDMRTGLNLLPDAHGGTDPHVWTDPLLMIQHVTQLANTLSQLFPEYADTIEHNRQALIQRLEQLHHDIEQRLAGRQQKHFLVFHPAWSYFAKRYGLKQLSIEHEGKSPNARRLAQLIEHAKAERLRVVLVQPQHNNTTAQVIAQAIGARLVTVDPLAEDYFASMRHLAKVLSTSSL